MCVCVCFRHDNFLNILSSCNILQMSLSISNKNFINFCIIFLLLWEYRNKILAL